jgi:hypothetical protein
MCQEAFRSGYGWLGLAVFVVCVRSHKKDSPSSGLFRAEVYNEHGVVQRNGTGMFPRARSCRSRQAASAKARAPGERPAPSGAVSAETPLFVGLG